MSKLYRDRSHRMIGGVCAGLANYFGVEAWMVRCVALTGLIFMTSLFFIAYWVLFFVMDASSDGQRRGAHSEGAGDHRSPAPELGSTRSPRHSLRNVRDALMQAELRLRRMESHIASGQYELQKELNKLDRGA